MDYVREDQLAKAKPLATRLSAGGLLFALLFVLPVLILLPLANVLAGCALAALATLWLAGKFLGATQQVSEIAFYLGLLAALPA